LFVQNTLNGAKFSSCWVTHKSFF